MTFKTPHTILARLSLLIAVILYQPAFAEPSLDQANDTLVMGVFPFVSGVTLFKRFAPMKDYLARALNRNIRLETARDFPTFVERTAHRNYDILITAPHFSLLAADNGDYQIVARPERDMQSLVVVEKTSLITNFSQLAGVSIATPPEEALATRAAKRYIEDKLSGKTSPVYQAFESHNAAYEAVIVHNTDAAIVSNNVVNSSSDKNERVRIIDVTPPLPSMVTMVSSKLPDAFARDVEHVFITMDESEEGREILKIAGFPGYISSRLSDYEPVRPYKPDNTYLTPDRPQPAR